MEKNSVSSYFIVKYADTDRMKRVYYSKYLEYFEVGRTDYLKQNYISYKKLEDKYKIYMPVVECYVKYIAPIEYEDKLKLKTTLEHFNKKNLNSYTNSQLVKNL
jgi:acyl-CoA thioester hydrolase